MTALGQAFMVLRCSLLTAWDRARSARRRARAKAALRFFTR